LALMVGGIAPAGCSERATPAPEPGPAPSDRVTPPAKPTPPASAELPSQPAQPAPGVEPARQADAPAQPAEPERSERGAAPAEMRGAANEPPAERAPEAAPRSSASEPAKPALAPAAAASCGDEGQPSCPLQGWMERNVQKPLDDGDFARLAQALSRVPRFAPDPSWNDGEQGWSKLAEAAAAAAKARDGDAVEQSCKACHRAWRKKYKQEFRLRPISD
jgi:hypothetical protein